MRGFYYLFLSLRPKHWLKNGFIFIPLVFAGLLFNYDAFLKVLNTFFIFCLAASSVYLINDVLDKEKDKEHPVKSKRPIASGKLSTGLVVLISALLMLLALLLSWQLSIKLTLFLSLYLILNIFYIFWLKNILFIDVFSVALGYVLRVYGGAAVLNLSVSPWLFLSILLLSLLLSFGKRKHELNLLTNQAKDHRRTLKYYSHNLLDQVINFVSALTVMSYILYAVAPETIAKFGTYNLIYTVPLVLYGMMRYLYILNNQKAGSPVEAFLEDRPLFFTVLLWGLAVVLIIYT